MLVNADPPATDFRFASILSSNGSACWAVIAMRCTLRRIILTACYVFAVLCCWVVLMGKWKPFKNTFLITFSNDCGVISENSLSVCLSACLCLCLSVPPPSLIVRTVCLSVCLLVSVSVCPISISDCQDSLSVRLCLFVSVCLSVCLCLSVSVCLCLSVCPTSFSLPFSLILSPLRLLELILSAYLTVCLSNSLSVCLSFRTYTYIHIHICSFQIHTFIHTCIHT